MSHEMETKFSPEQTIIRKMFTQPFVHQNELEQILPKKQLTPFLNTLYEQLKKMGFSLAHVKVRDQSYYLVYIPNYLPPLDDDSILIYSIFLYLSNRNKDALPASEVQILFENFKDQFQKFKAFNLIANNNDGTISPTPLGKVLFTQFVQQLEELIRLYLKEHL